MNSTETLTSWVAVRRPALQHNIAAIQARLNEDARTPKLIAVVKANGYGHGLVNAARIAAEAGVGMLAVTTAEESLALRAAGITAPILQFLPALPAQLPDLVAAGIVLTVGSLDDLAALSAVAPPKPLPVHLKIDIGMGRIGILPNQALLLARSAADNKSVDVQGTYSHCSRALERSFDAAQRQCDQFLTTINEIKAAGIHPGVCHCANSAVFLREPRFWCDAVRIGTLLYGQYPSASVPKTLALQDTWQLKARVVSVKDVPAGTPVGYGSEFVTRRSSRLAVLGIGYADGLTVAPASAGKQSWVKALARSLGHSPALQASFECGKAPLVGRIAMQTCVADVTDCVAVAVGDVARLSSRRITTPAHVPRIIFDD